MFLYAFVDNGRSIPEECMVAVRVNSTLKLPVLCFNPDFPVESLLLSMLKVVENSAHKAFEAYYQNHGWANQLGIRFDTDKKGAPFLRMPFKTSNLNADTEFGSIHGGVSASMLLDAGHMIAAITVPEIPPEDFYIAESQFFYLRGSRDRELYATAKVTRRTRKLLFIDAEIHDDQGDHLLTSRQIYSMQPPDTLAIDHAVDQSPRHWLKQDMSLHPLAEQFQELKERFAGGLDFAFLERHRCGITVDYEDNKCDPRGHLAPGPMVFAADHGGIMAHYASEATPSLGSTVDLKMTFCDVAKQEGTIAINEILAAKGQQRQMRLTVFGQESHTLKAFGTMTLWVR